MKRIKIKPSDIEVGSFYHAHFVTAPSLFWLVKMSSRGYPGEITHIGTLKVLEIRIPWHFRLTARFTISLWSDFYSEAFELSSSKIFSIEKISCLELLFLHLLD